MHAYLDVKHHVVNIDNGELASQEYDPHHEV